MENIGELKRLINREIFTIKLQEKFHQILQIVAVLIVLFLGGATTVLAAIKYDNQLLIAFLAASTTFVGILEKTFNFRKNAHAYRLTKTEFQNLEIDTITTSGNDFEKLVEELKKIRLNKAERTTA